MPRVRKPSPAAVTKLLRESGGKTLDGVRGALALPEATALLPVLRALIEKGKLREVPGLAGAASTFVTLPPLPRARLRVPPPPTGAKRDLGPSDLLSPASFRKLSKVFALERARRAKQRATLDAYGEKLGAQLGALEPYAGSAVHADALARARGELREAQERVRALGVRLAAIEEELARREAVATGIVAAALSGLPVPSASAASGDVPPGILPAVPPTDTAARARMVERIRTRYPEVDDRGRFFGAVPIPRLLEALDLDAGAPVDRATFHAALLALAATAQVDLNPMNDPTRLTDAERAADLRHPDGSLRHFVVWRRS
ncbi:MAG: hypothetical protein HYZ53_26420 [Planctomycetes bacterium]|nr:hypothetical protein [Planctomycetota bacterium]